MDRRLAAILMADVVGYSHLVEVDEAGTLAALKRRRTTILQPLVARHQGRIVKVMGDGVLLEFASAVNAAQCAADLQRAMAMANEDVPQEKQIVLRVGISLGDVVVEAGDLYGAGVNIAARLEAICEPGGICITDAVQREIRGKVSFRFEDLGEQRLKNMAEPVRAYRMLSEMAQDEQSAGERVASSKPSIAVLPFANMSGDPEQEYFADGITEDIITELSHFSSLSVIARNSSFRYRGKAQDLHKVGRDLGSRYLVEGSVRSLGPKIRITAQLIDATTGRHLWAERYDRQLEELFDVQDEVVRAVVTCSEHRIADIEAEQSKRRPPNSWLAYDWVLQARRCLAHYGHYEEAEAPLLRAIQLDPELVEAHAKLATVEISRFWHTLDDRHIDKAYEHARKSLSIDESSSEAHMAMSLACHFQGRTDLALSYAETALLLNPNNVLAFVDRAQWLVYIGREAEALADIERMLKRDPIPPTWYWDTKGSALFQLRRYHEAIECLNMVDERQYWEMAYMAASLAYLGRTADARREVKLLLDAQPNMTIPKLLKVELYRNPEHFAEGLRRAGLPE